MLSEDSFWPCWHTDMSVLQLSNCGRVISVVQRKKSGLALKNPGWLNPWLWHWLTERPQNSHYVYHGPHLFVKWSYTSASSRISTESMNVGCRFLVSLKFPNSVYYYYRDIDCLKDWKRFWVHSFNADRCFLQLQSPGERNKERKIQVCESQRQLILFHDIINKYFPMLHSDDI